MAVHILLLDDDSARGSIIRELLRPKGYTVTEESDTDKAVLLLNDGVFDLILLDIALPNRTGFRMLEYLKLHHTESKVIVMTCASAMEKAIKAGTTEEWDFVTRPFNSEFFLRLVDFVLADQGGISHKIQIIKAGDFIKSSPTGDLDLHASQLGFMQIAAAAAHLDAFTVMIDLREIRSRLTITSIYHLASELEKYGTTFRRKSAVLVRDDTDLSQAMFFETAANNQGFNVKVFTEFEAAVHWLSGGTKHAAA